MNKKKERIIEIGFKNEFIQSCIELDEIFRVLENLNIKENLNKCLISRSKLFTHYYPYFLNGKCDLNGKHKEMGRPGSLG